MPTVPRRVLFVLTSHAELGATGKPTGAYLPEISHPHAVLTAAGFEVDFVSPKGGRVPLYGLDASDEASVRFLGDEPTLARLHDSATPERIDPSQYAAVFYAGGHGAMWDLGDQPTLARVAAQIWEAGGVVAAVCHGPAGLLGIHLSDGAPLLAGRRVAGFTNDEERAVGLAEVVPWLLADALEARGATHVPAPNWAANVVVDGRLVTGQNPASATGVGEAVARLLGDRARGAAVG
ncbi:MAG: type 1 glutamine amidotransferase domain-containing protein [Myxococcota bacterium]